MEQNCWYKNRVCFHPIFGEEAYTLSVPILDDITRRPQSSAEKKFTIDEFLEWLYDFNSDFNPDMPAFEIIQAYINRRDKNKEVCLTGFIDIDLGMMIDLEASCFNYHQLPFDGGVLDQPLLFMEAFNTIRAEVNRFEKVRADKLLSKSTDSSKKTR